MCCFTIHTNIFTGLNISAVKNDSDYDNAWVILVVGLSFICGFAMIDFIIQIIGFSYNFNKCNIISKS